MISAAGDVVAGACSPAVADVVASKTAVAKMRRKAAAIELRISSASLIPLN
jgi:hypothetical protein